MKLNCQKTIAKSAVVKGRGLFGGEQTTLTINPADPDTGIVFVRVDLPDKVRIPARISGVAARPQRTALQNGTVAVETVEHCLGALAGMEIDNAELTIDGSELPNIDGSCDAYTQAIIEAGTAEQDRPRQMYVITEPVVAQDGEGLLYALPENADELNIIYDLNYSDAAIGRQLMRYQAACDNFVRDISPARTFLTEGQAAEAQKAGIGAHLSARDVLILGADGPIDNELRFADECVRHKIADLLGDMMLLGRPIRGRLVAYRSGHRCNHLMVRKLTRLLEKDGQRRPLSSEAVLDVRKIQRILPHRYPFLLVDRVIELDGDRRAVGIKNVTMNEQFFQGHFPGTPIMPGVLILEALAQMSGLLFAQRLEHTGQLAVLLSMDKVKMRRAVVPGDQLILESQAVRIKNRSGDCRCRALVGDQVAAEAQIRFMLVDADPV